MARHGSEGAQQQQHGVLRDAAATVLAQERKNGAQVAACRACKAGL